MRLFDRMLAVAALSILSASASAGQPNENFIVRTTMKSPAEVQSRIQAYVRRMDWIYVGDNTLKKGQVLQVRTCVPALGKLLWSAGMHVAAMAPCGQIGIWVSDGVTHVSMLHPRFLNVLYPNPSLRQMGDELLPLLTGMLDDAVRQ